jgi:DNA-binding transcriptional regulator GbsR (MarR family)
MLPGRRFGPPAIVPWVTSLSSDHVPNAVVERSAEGLTPEDVRVAFADIWGDMGPAWNVTPSVARVHGYLLIWGSLLTERDVREALGLSHRAASLALAELEDWGLVERVEDMPREARPGPPAVAWRVVGDRWRWFQRVAEERRAREADPLQPRLATCLELADQVVTAWPQDREAQQVRGWLAEIQGFVTLFDRALRTLSRAESAEIARGFTVLARISDETLDRLLRILGSLPEDELAETLEAIARTSPDTARRVMRAANRVARLAR